jgi:glycerate kinase
MTPQRVLVAAAAFKGTLSPRAVTDALASGVRQVLPDATVATCPIADGGDGLLEAVLPAARRRDLLKVSGPSQQTVTATIGWLDSHTAIVESAAACGLALVPPDARDPLSATSRGVGELIREAVARGAESVIVGLGGSATTDGGCGAARALGWTFHDAAGARLPEGGGALADLAEIESGGRVAARVVALADVGTPLAGSRGAARVFAPQKGANAAQVERLALGLDRLAAVWARHGRPDLATLAMGGAAGGLGAGLVFFAGAELVAGASWVLERVGFDTALAGADLLLTGEGVFDATSLAGKAVGEVVRRAQAAHCRVAVIAGAARDAAGVRVVDGGGRHLDERDLAALAARATRDAFGLPAPGTSV